METITYKGVKVHNIGEFPKGYNYTYGNIEALSEYDLDQIVAVGVNEAWYWYARAPYEGNGKILMRRGKLYSMDSLSHCSCYGAAERLDNDFKQISDIKMSDEFKRKTMNLLKAAGVI